MGNSFFDNQNQRDFVQIIILGLADKDLCIDYVLKNVYIFELMLVDKEKSSLSLTVVLVCALIAFPNLIFIDDLEEESHISFFCLFKAREV